MTASRTALRLVALLLLLAGILLLRKPLFGQAITAAPTRFSIIIEGVTPPPAKAPSESSYPNPGYKSRSDRPNRGPYK